MTAAAIVALATAAIYLPHIVDRARRNRRTRQARTEARECHANHWADSSEAVGPRDEPAESTPIHDRLVCEQMERAEGWAS